MADRGMPDPSDVLKNPAKAREVVRGAVVFVIGAWLLWAFLGAFVVDRTQAGTFGDFFGAINTLFSGLALLGVVYAVILQHQEIEATNEQLRIARDEQERARADAKESDDARRRAEQMMAEQTRLMYSTARMQAASSIAEATQAIAQLETVSQQSEASFVIRDQITDIEQARQYQRIVLVDIDNPGLDEGLVQPVRPVTMYRKYAAITLRQAARRLQSSRNERPRDDWEMGYDVVAPGRVLRELDLLIRQDGVSGTPDEATFVKARNGLSEHIRMRKTTEAGRILGERRAAKDVTLDYRKRRQEAADELRDALVLRLLQTADDVLVG